MNLICYAKPNSCAGKRLQKVISAIVPREQIELFRSIDSLSRRLCVATYNLNVAVLLASSRKDLSEILSIRDLFRDIRIILILPDRDRDTISQGHKLYPRFLSYVDDNFADVAAVLEKMLRITESNNLNLIN